VNIRHLFVLIATEHKLGFVLLQELGTSLDINKEGIDLTDICDVNLSGLTLDGHEITDSDEMDGVTERALFADLG